MFFLTQSNHQPLLWQEDDKSILRASIQYHMPAIKTSLI